VKRVPKIDFDLSAAIWEAGRKATAAVDEAERQLCRKAVKAEFRDLPKWARGAVPGVILLKTPEITAAALRAGCRACGKCLDMVD